MTAADIDRDRAAALGVALVDPATAHAVECDVFAPCALGGVLDAGHIAELRCRAVVGAANNQLATPASADLLAERGIVYAPDYVVNAGGIISVAEELRGGEASSGSPSGWPGSRPPPSRSSSGPRADGVTTAAAADAMAEARLARARAGMAEPTGGPSPARPR